ncbi:hypothetical protein J7I80_17175 [Bacillus sp. ISL-41]|uniref:hypothetical protein n=1 Tax=Bacillus sp. ISL-41 TaxID=2819127 RepID=UPI001BE53EA8|nr:hypothetical protein [Bacillus sp. ISL-41]MBT2643979.1 hypothetical protein [Bacillus sp. ISL-41]
MPLWRHKKKRNQQKAASITLMETPKEAEPAKSGIHCPYGDTKRSGTSKKRHPLPLWRHKKKRNQQKASSIALMETQKEAEPAKSVIHCPYRDTKRSGTSKKRHPLPLWRHKKKRNQQKAASIALMETQKEAEPAKSDIHCPYGDTKRSGTSKKRHPLPLWRHQKKRNQQKASSIALMETQKEAEPAKSVIHTPYGDTKRRRVRKKRHPLPLWRHQKKRNQQKASSIILMETREEAMSANFVCN